MITVSDAQNLILENTIRGQIKLCPLDECLGFVLAEAVVSPISMPLFNSSAMDGYAVRSEDTETSRIVVEDIWAGKNPEKIIGPNQCARIMTGAVLPHGADTVVMQEYVTRDNDRITINKATKPGDNVRQRGEEFETGDLLLARGTTLNSRNVALAAAAGLGKLFVVSKPKVAIVVTGTELVAPGSPRAAHQIFESNSHALKAALAETGFTTTVYGPIEDNIEILTQTIRKALNEATHVIICGGVSVGDHDHNKNILANLGVQEVFWKVAQKPGKPLYFGTKKDTLVFGLPGNPASSLVCFYEYVLASLMKYSGKTSCRLKSSEAQLTQSITKKNDFTHFLTATAEMKNQTLMVSQNKNQASHMLTGFSQANCLIVFDGADTKKEALENVTIHWLPSGEAI